jgi:hypothetical protein
MQGRAKNATGRQGNEMKGHRLQGQGQGRQATGIDTGHRRNKGTAHRRTGARADRAGRADRGRRKDRPSEGQTSQMDRETEPGPQMKRWTTGRKGPKEGRKEGRLAGWLATKHPPPLRTGRRCLRPLLKFAPYFPQNLSQNQDKFGNLQSWSRKIRG